MDNVPRSAVRPVAFGGSGLSFNCLQRWFIHHVGSASPRARRADKQ
jgi:hypothetical protein